MSGARQVVPDGQAFAGDGGQNGIRTCSGGYLQLRHLQDASVVACPSGEQACELGKLPVLNLFAFRGVERSDEDVDVRPHLSADSGAQDSGIDRCHRPALDVTVDTVQQLTSKVASTMMAGAARWS